MGRKFYFIELPIGSKMNNDFYAFLMNHGYTKQAETGTVGQFNTNLT
jgi:hypothetical protein